MEGEPHARFEDVRSFARALLPLADARTRLAWERDFAPGAGVPSSPAGPLVTQAPPSSAPRATPQVPASLPPTQTSTVRTTSRLPCEPGASPFHLKGIAYRGFRRLVDRRVPGGLPALEQELDDPRLASFVRQPFLAASRYDLLPMLPLNEAAARLLRTPLDALASDQGARQAAYDIDKLYGRLFAAMTFENPALVLPRFDVQYSDFGDCTADMNEPGYVTLRRAGVPGYVLPWFVPMYSAYAEYVLRRKGAAFVEAIPQPPRDAGVRDSFPIVDIEWALRWRI
jgi:hypothetical protein